MSATIIDAATLLSDLPALATEPERTSYEIAPPDPCTIARAALADAEADFQRARLYPPGYAYDRAEERVIRARCALRAAEHAAAKARERERKQQADADRIERLRAEAGE